MGIKISDEITLLRKLADVYYTEWEEEAALAFVRAADIMEALSSKLADMEQTDRKLVLKNTYFVKRKRKDDVIVSIMYNKADNKYHFVNLSKNHICSCGFETIEEAIADMGARRNKSSINGFYLIGRPEEGGGSRWIYSGGGRGIMGKDGLRP